MQEKDKGNANGLKKIVSNLDQNRKNVQANKEVSSSISQAKQSFSEFQNVIRGQTNAINSIKAFEKTMANESSRSLEVKKFFLNFYEKTKFEIGKLMRIGQQLFQNQGQKPIKEDDFRKTIEELNKILVAIKDESDTSQKMYVGIHKLLEIRENIICQFLRVMLYRKNVLWRDLNIKFDDYIHAEVKAVLNKIKDNEQKYGYVPSSIPFKLPKIDLEAQSALPDLLNIVLRDEAELIDSMKNFSKLSQEPQIIEDISKNQHVVKGLRQKIEVLTKNYNSLMQKYRTLQISKGKTQMGQNQQKSLSQKIQDLQSLVMKKEQDIIQLKQTSIKSETTIQTLKDKNKQLEDQISKWQNLQLPKIKELELAQKTLFDEFSKAKKDFETYNNLYQTERQDKIKAYSDLKDEKSRLTEMANILGRERRKIKELKAEIMRKDQVIMEIVQQAPQP